MLSTPPGSWPGSSADVEHWARAMLRAQDSEQDAPVHGLGGVRVFADVVGPDLRAFDVDATGARLRLRTPGPTVPSDVLHEPAPSVVRSVEGMLRALTVHAAPMHLEDAEVTLDLRIDELPIRW